MRMGSWWIDSHTDRE